MRGRVWTFLRGVLADLLRDLFVECPQCSAVIPNNEKSIDRHDRHHLHMRLRP